MNQQPPSVSVCFGLMDQFEMLPNIKEHSIVVAKLAAALHIKLDKSHHKTELPAKNLLIAGGLLHDIAKTKCIKEGCHHANEGAEICENLNLPQIAEIVREHVLLQDFDPERYKQGIFNAKELVYYADKRVMHDKIVSLDERLDYILERYGQNDPYRSKLIKRNFIRCQELEKWICTNAETDATSLVTKLPPIE